MPRTPLTPPRPARPPRPGSPPRPASARRPAAPGASRSRKGSSRRPTGAADEPGSHDRILDAALDEFAVRGFAGARVDRIAAAAHLNKAMLYYHFGSKARLYRTTIQRVIGTLGDHMEAIAESPGTASEKLSRFIETFIRLGMSQPRIAPLMLREIAEGAAHIDDDTVRRMLRVVGAMGRIVAEGRTSGEFREVNPLMAYLTTAWPIMVYLASGRVRESLLVQSHLDADGFSPDVFIRHMQDVSLRALAAEPVTGPAPHAAPTHPEQE